MDNRRKTERVGVSFPVECSVLVKPNYFYTVSKDLSLTGTRIVSSDFLPKGNALKVHLNLVDKVIDAKAKVCWCSKDRVSDRYFAGLEFTEMNEFNKRALSDFLNNVYPA